MEHIRPGSSGNNSGPSRPVSSQSVSKALSSPSLASKVLVVLLIVASVVFIANMTMQVLGKGRTSLGNAKINTDAYQAVFLTNGQVYFGKMENPNSAYVKLTDIYYLQVAQATDDKTIQDAKDQQQPKISLAKLGKELHGPEDSMFISRDQVLFWENLKDKDNSQVTKAIEDFKAQGGQNQ